MWMSTKPIAATFTVGVVILILGLAAGICWSQVYDWIYHSQLSLTPTSTNFQLWKETPIPMYLKLYMFNWTNPEEFTSENNVKPHFVEMGPYVFRQVDYKVHYEWNDNHTITFQRKRIWHFDESLSNGTLDDEVTNLDPIAASVAYTLRFKDRTFRDLANRFLKVFGHKLVTTKRVHELLFDGYEDKMLIVARKLKLSPMPWNKFGWFYARNESDTYDGTFNMDTGTSNMLDLGMIKEWNFHTTSKYYADGCNTIIGSNGEIWPPMENNDTATIFVTDVCTNLNLAYEETVTYLGLQGRKYHATPEMFDDGTLVPERKCYCKDVECVPSGALNISLCKFEAPVFATLPHFYLADPSYLDAVSGLEPSKEKHDMTLVLQPATGVPMQVKAQLQVNILIQPDPDMTLFKNVRRTFIPMMWFTQEANLTPDYASKVKLIVILPSLGAITCFGVAAIGFLIAFIGVFLFVRRRWQGEEGQVLIPREDNLDAPRVNAS